MLVRHGLIRGGSRICGKGGRSGGGISKGGAQGVCALFGPPWRPSLEFQKGGRAPPAPPPPESASVDFMDFTMGDDKIVPSIMSYSPQGFTYLMKAIKCLHYTEMFLFLSTTVVPRQLRPTHIRALFSMSVWSWHVLWKIHQRTRWD